MNQNLLITTAFITLPIADAIVGSIISGIRGFSKENLQERIKKNLQNGNYKGFKVVEIEVDKCHCKECGPQIIIPQASNAVIKNCYEVHDFVGQCQ